MGKEKKYKILIIDDEAPIRHVCEKSLAKLSEAIDSVGSAEDARILIQKNKYDLVLLDLMLPGMNGDVFLKELKKENPGIEVIVVAGAADISTAVNIMKDGAFDFIVKPFEVAQLRSVVSKALSKAAVLIVDDDEGVVTSIERIIKRKFPGVDIHVETKASALPELLKNNKYRIMFMDIKLEMDDGLNIVEELISKKFVEPSDVVMMTGYPSDEVKSKIKELAIGKLLEKPFFLDDILTILTEKLPSGKS